MNEISAKEQYQDYDYADQPEDYDYVEESRDYESARNVPTSEAATQTRL